MYSSSRLLNVIITLLSCVAHVISEFQCQGTCYSGSFPKNNQVIKGKHLRGYSNKNITTDVSRTCFSSCVNDCRCKAFQMKDVRCELLDEDKTSKAADFVNETGYVYYDLQQTFYKGKSHMVHPAGVCYNGCCRSQPCMNGGTCVEHCETPKVKFSCKCPNTIGGKTCEMKIKSCIDVLKGTAPGTMPANGTYIITRSDNKTTVPVYCAFESPNQTWTLIESFSLQNNYVFNNKAFHQNHPRNQESHNWNDYRLSLSSMKYIQTKATMFRATCEYQNRDSLTPGFVLGYKKDFDIINSGNQRGYCVNFSYANFKGYEFQRQRVPIWHAKDQWHLHLDISLGLCGFTPPAATYIHNEDNFGHYNAINQAFKCTATNQSTIQWWLGEQQ
ncbi:uncharacterized protein LOC116287636 isoform X1 [Actinia tenebrosa]|uniref:Uncharacterized protein LOC116287636 isoform X1 n=1 Tax=Actinia tenebrosa TaxID=6105 RepID=A0A6P8H3K8_ACTTE|nr:uncharacterized protein LOC116287636 isoform X1 [Actinia tenebrosa]XP_031550178.1 uncharacterized protein LOC116287636 isoform X1 [Actinia tenebrosa]